MTLPRLLVLTDRKQLPGGRSLAEVIVEGVEAGLTHVVLRELDLSDERRAELAVALAGAGASVIAAHRPLPGTIGTQLSSRATGPALGRSCHSRVEVAGAAAEGAAYATLGPFGASLSKPGYGPLLPPSELHGHPIPVYALGGVTPSNAAELIGAGAYGVAVMGPVMRASAPGPVVRDLLAAIG